MRNVPVIDYSDAKKIIDLIVEKAAQMQKSVVVAIADSHGELIAFARMDGAQLGSIAISEHKARAAAKYRRPTHAFEDAMQRGYVYVGTLDDVIASRGGIPLVEDGKLIGAIGCSGATGSQDEVVCTAGAATINK